MGTEASLSETFIPFMVGGYRIRLLFYGVRDRSARIFITARFCLVPMDERLGPVTVILLIAGIILMPVGLYLNATGSVSAVFFAGTAVLVAGIALAAYRGYMLPREASQNSHSSQSKRVRPK